VPPHEGVIEMTDELLPVEGISRRDLLKRTAIVGGASALVWAAPSITTLGNRAFGATGTPLGGWSFAAFIVVCNGTQYRAKWNYNEGDPAFEQGIGLPSCTSDPLEDPAVAAFVDDYQNHSGVGGLDLFTPNPPTQSGTLVTFTITSDTCTIKNGMSSGVAKEGEDCQAGGTVSGDGKSITYDVSIFV
jgi:hypothetical protein